MRWLRSIYVSVAIATVLLSALNGIGAAAPADKFAPAAELLADYTVSSATTTVDDDLRAVGFTDARQQRVVDWHGLSPLRKIETAYYAAKQGGTEQDFLALLARNLAASHPTLKAERTVAGLLKHTPGPIKYKDLRKPLATKPSSKDVRRAIVVLARHIEGNDVTFVEEVLRAGGLTDEAVLYDVLRESGPRRRDALLRGVARAKTTRAQTEMIASMAAHVREHGGPRAKSDPNLERYARGDLERPARSPTPQPTEPTPKPPTRRPFKPKLDCPPVGGAIQH